MACVRIAVTDPPLQQIVRSLVENWLKHGGDHVALLVAELTGDPNCKGASVIRELRSARPDLPVIAISRFDGASITQQAVRLGVDDYFTLPSESAGFEAAVAALILGREAPEKAGPPQNVLLGDSPQIVLLRKYVARVAMTESSVLITGETGTGKELVAELIHKSGARRDKPFVCVNSAALPETLIESELFGFEKGAFTGAHAKYEGKLRMAHGGTIFFDEIGDLSLGAQAKLLRAIESREVHPLGGWRGMTIDIRIIAATNRDVDTMIQSREFRQDLFYRLNVVRIELPPLRSRREDIPRLLAHFITTYNRQLNRRVEAFHPAAMDLLQAYDWPGNIRELRNVVESSFVNATSDRIELIDLPERLQRALQDHLEPDSREKLVRTLLATNWNVSRTAGELQCSRMTVYRKMAHYELSRSADHPAKLTAKA